MPIQATLEEEGFWQGCIVFVASKLCCIWTLKGSCSLKIPKRISEAFSFILIVSMVLVTDVSIHQ